MPRVVFNQKGGVGKSTITCNLAAKGLPVLQPYLPSSIRIRESHEQSLPMIYLDPRHKLTLAR